MDDFLVFVQTSSIQLVVFIAILVLSCREDRQSGFACPTANGVERNQGESFHTCSNKIQILNILKDSNQFCENTCHFTTIFPQGSLETKEFYTFCSALLKCNCTSMLYIFSTFIDFCTLFCLSSMYFCAIRKKWFWFAIQCISQFYLAYPDSIILALNGTILYF